MSGATFLMDELRRTRIAANLSQEDLGKLINYSASHVSAVETGARSPRADYLAAVDEALHTGGLFTRVLDEVVILDHALPWLRDWILIEREARALRWFEPTWVPGLLQTEAYARATLAGEMLTPDEVDQLVGSRQATAVCGSPGRVDPAPSRTWQREIDGRPA
jgi:transcriptional regulator with XRE-family HTH domain